MTDRPAGPLASGAVVDGYRILRPLAAGGNGAVYAAVTIASGRAVALKALRDDRDDGAARTRFERESAAANATRHPGIVPVLATGTLSDGRPYLVLPLLEGRSLREELEARGPLPDRDAWEIVRQVAAALGAAHENGVVHRDVKPENVFLEHAAGATPRVRVLDFGIAKQIEDAGLSRLTGTGAPLGTPAYMAPEQWWAAPVDGRTDQYALGAVLFELLTGQPPFEAQSFAELLQKHLHEPPPVLTSNADAVVRRMLAKGKTDRFATMAELVREGDRVLSHAPASARASETLSRSGTVMAIAAAGAALLVGVGYAGRARRDVVAWFVGGGIPFQIAIAVIAITALLSVARRTRVQVIFWLALAPAFAGIGTTYAGWAMVKEATRRALPLARLDVLHEGIFEINMLRFLGFGLAAVVLVALAVVNARSRVTALDRSFAVVVAAGLAAAVAFTRIEAREAAAWSIDATRIERVREIVGAARERSVTTVLVCIVLATVVVIETFRLRRSAREQPGSLAGWRRRFGMLLGAVAIAAFADVWLHVELAEARAAVRRVLAPQFALFAALDPPKAEVGVDGLPHRATALQISRTMVAVNGVPVAPIAALTSPEGQAHVGAEIDRALATAAVEGENATLVSLMVDREVSFGVVRRLLLRARASGATTAEVLLTRGETPDMPADAPGEATLVKATDFVALAVFVGDAGAEPRDDQRFGEVVPALVRSAGHLRSDVLSTGQ